MDSITETSLQALIYKATDSRNGGVDNAAVEAFCGILNKNPEYAYTATKLLVSRIQSPDKWEAMRGLAVLDTCMKKCGSSFHSEVGKFRFLNELIKMVSPKYLGPRTNPKVRDLVIKILYAWTINYTKEPKIKEAYEMLKKQGVILEEVRKPTGTTSKTNLPIDHEFENKLKKLLNSRNPEDLEAANRMIKSRVLETERRTTELERVRTNVRLLAEMVGNCQPGAIPPEDLQLMGEIHTECERLRPVVFRLAGETQESDILTDILNLSEELTLVFEKYAKVVSQNGSQKQPVPPSPSSLLDLSSPVEETNLPISQPQGPVNDLLGAANSVLDLNTSSPALSLDALSLLPPPENSVAVGNDLDQLGAIFGSLSASSSANSSSNIPLRHPPPAAEKTNKQKALDELDVLGESLLQQCKNDIPNHKEVEASVSRNGADDEIMDLAGPKSLDDVMLDLGDPSQITAGSACSNVTTNGKPANDSCTPVREPVLPVKPLSDVSVTLEKITPSNIPPLRVLESCNEVDIMVHLARDSPREDVSVYVVTTTSTSNLPLSDYLFQVVVPKGCKFKLQPPSATSLPAHNPFLPPAAITQILLIANPSALKLTLTFMLSFTREDETITEVGEIPELPTPQK